MCGAGEPCMAIGLLLGPPTSWRRHCGTAGASSLRPPTSTCGRMRLGAGDRGGGSGEPTPNELLGCAFHLHRFAFLRLLDDQVYRGRASGRLVLGDRRSILQEPDRFTVRGQLNDLFQPLKG
jgi:hypothetical protein